MSLDTKKIEAALAARHVEESSEAARKLGAATEDVATLALHLSRISVWRQHVNTEADPHISEVQYGGCDGNDGRFWDAPRIDHDHRHQDS